MSDIRFEEFDTPRLKFRVSVLDQKMVLASVAARWKEQYGSTGEWRDTTSGNSKVVYNNLIALDYSTATRKDIADIIGNDSWTHAECRACAEPSFPVVLFERFSEWSSEPAAETKICAHCIAAGADAISRSRAPSSTGEQP